MADPIPFSVRLMREDGKSVPDIFEALSVHLDDNLIAAEKDSHTKVIGLSWQLLGGIEFVVADTDAFLKAAIGSGASPSDIQATNALAGEWARYLAQRSTGLGRKYDVLESAPCGVPGTIPDAFRGDYGIRIKPEHSRKASDI
jgi:hypothetical protein